MSKSAIAFPVDEHELRDQLVGVLLRRSGDAPENMLVPPSFEQQRMWFAMRLEGAGATYNLCNVIAMPGSVSAELLSRCFEVLLERHSALRARFVEHDGLPQLSVLAYEQCGFQLRIEECGADSHDSAISEALDRERNHRFDLTGECLIRAIYLVNPDGAGALVINVHHIVTDAWSLANFAEEFAEVVRAMAESRQPSLSTLHARYSDYGLWQAAWLGGPEAREQAAFWRRRLRGVIPLKLSMCAERPEQRTSAGASIRFNLAPEIVSALDAMQAECGATLFATLSAAVALTLHAFGAAPDIALGTSVSTRRETVLEPVFGLFLNQVVLRLDLSANPDLREFIAQAVNVVREALANRDLPFGQVVAEIAPERDPSRSPLFDVLISLQNTPRSTLQSATVGAQQAPELAAAKFDLSFFFEEERGRLSGQLVYSTQLFSREHGRRLVECVQEVLTHMPSKLDFATSKFKSQLRSVDFVETPTREAIAVSRFKRGERKAVNLSELRVVDEAPMHGAMPYVFQARERGVDALAWLGANKASVEARRSEFGAVLLRGFDLAEIGTFDRVIQLMCRKVIAGYGDLPEEKGTDRVYGSTPYPNDRRILFHSESSHMASWPLHQFFACVIASQTGGETPIVDVRKIYARLSATLRTRFTDGGLNYVRHFIPGLDVPWQSFFKTRERSEVERQCRASGAVCTWKHDDILMVGQPSQAVAQHPLTGAWSFFNQIMLHHPYFLRSEERSALVSLYGKENLPRLVTFGDGSEIEESTLAELVDLYEQESVAFPWQAGDLLMLDNMSIAHARNPFTGPRKIIVGMGDPIESFR